MTSPKSPRVGKTHLFKAGERIARTGGDNAHATMIKWCKDNKLIRDECSEVLAGFRNEDNEKLADYEVREGNNGKSGIFLREYNVRLATFADNSHFLVALLKQVFDDAYDQLSLAGKHK